MATAPNRRTTVAVQPGGAIVSWSRLFSALEAAFPVCFKPAAEDLNAAATIALCPGDAFPSVAEIGQKGTPVLAIGGEPRSQARPRKFVVSDGASVDPRIRGISAFDRLDGPSLESTGEGEEILAGVRSQAVWTKSAGSAPVYRVCSSLPELEPAQSLRDLFAGRALVLIALTHFLRAVSAANAAEPPPLRAAILFDDPNLRWRTYGFIDYRRLLEHADAHGYHASMAMIPLDVRHQHRATVQLFRERPDRLSLILHGNNHVSQELMRPSSEAEALAISAQALRRAAHFEAHYDLRMDRVMTPPHGLCAANVARALGALGFDALCAIHPLPWTEQTPADRPLAGWDPAEFAAGCAVIPRVPLDTDIAEIALRAYLDQPLILYGHHDDLADGLDLLAQTAAKVNRLGDVRWSSLGEIAASNYSSRLDDGALTIQPYAHRLQVKLPDGARSLSIAAPRGADHGFSGWNSAGESIAFDSPVPAQEGELEIRLTSAVATDPENVPDPTTRVWPVLRRAATETRDRLRPLLPVGSA